MSELISANSVVLRGEAVAINSDIGSAFVTDLCREHESTEECMLISIDELKLKWALSGEQVAAIGSNETLLKAVRAELERRVYSGAAARDAAAVAFAKAPQRLHHMLHDKLEASRVKIDAAKELRAIAGGGTPETASGQTFQITIITAPPGDKNPSLPFVVEVQPQPDPPPQLAPITIVPPTSDDGSGATA